MCKSIIFSLSFLATGAFCATSDFVYNEQGEEDRLLNEIVDETLKRYGIHTDLGFEGALNFTAASCKQDNNKGYKDTTYTMQGDIDFRYRKNYGGVCLGAEARIKADSKRIRDDSTVVRTSFLFAEFDKWGIVRVGYTNSAADLFSICGDKFLVGYDGPGSTNLPVFYNTSAGAIISTGFPHDDLKALKVTLLTPTIVGFSAGMSYTPDSRYVGIFKTKYRGALSGLDEKADFVSNKTAYSKNNITAGIAYEFGDPDSLNAKISLAGWWGKGAAGVAGAEVHDIRAFSIGAMVFYKALNVSVGYTDCGKSLTTKKYAAEEIHMFDKNIDYDFADNRVGLLPGADAGKLMSIGASYTFGKLVASLGYFRSFVKFSGSEKACGSVVTAALEYTFNKAIRWYVEYDRITTSTCARAQAYAQSCGKDPIGRNMANVFMTGIKAFI